MTTEQITVASGNASWMLMSASLVLLMTPALALFYGGMSREKSVLNMMMMSFGAVGIVSVVYVLWGWSMSYGSHSILGMFANPMEYFGLKNALIDDSGNYIEGPRGYPQIIDVGFQLTFAAISVSLISGALAERVKFSTWLVFSALWVTAVYFPLAHMVWGAGLLSDSAEGVSAQIFGIADGKAIVAPIDFAGGTVVHISAGSAALVLAIIVGKRRNFMKIPHRPHSLPLVMLGAALLWFGWFGFNAGSAFAADGKAGLAWLNTTVAAGAAMLGWLAFERIRDGHATSLGAASGVVAGLVAITPAAGDLHPLTSIILGAIGGVLCAWAVGLKFRFGFDDSLDVVGVHLVGALWGTIGVGLLATDRGLLTGGGVEGLKLFVVQILIALCAMAFAGGLSAALGWVLKQTMGWRLAAEDESSGVDVSHHGESAYDSAF